MAPIGAIFVLRATAENRAMADPVATPGGGAMRATLLTLAALLIIGHSIPFGNAQDAAPLLTLPQLRACTSAPHPRLPGLWRATYLMAPFTSGQLVLGE